MTSARFLVEIAAARFLRRRLQSRHFPFLESFKTVPSTPILRLLLDESPNRTEVALMSQKIRLFGAIGPEIDGVR